MAYLGQTGQPDNIQLLSTTITTTGAGTSIDCTSYGAVQWQLSGSWSGAARFEASNDNTNWFPHRCIESTSALSIDTVSSAGIYQVQPVGRYIRINTTIISGSMVVLALGRANPTVFAQDSLALAMDQSNNTPMNVAVGNLSKDSNNSLFTAPNESVFYVGSTATAGANLISSFDTLGFQSVFVWIKNGAGTANLQWSDDGISGWVAGVAAGVGSTEVYTTNNRSFAATGTQFIAPVQGRFCRVNLATYTSGLPLAIARPRMTPAFQYTPSQTVTVSGTVSTNTNAGTNAIGDVGIQYRANNTGAASVVSVLSPATPAAATIKASAGRLLGWNLQNSAAAFRSVKVFNATAPTLGTTAAIFEIDIPAGGLASMQLEGGIGFATAMTYSVTSAKGLTDNTATGLAANDVSGLFVFA